MSSSNKNLSDYDQTSIPDGKAYKVAVVVSEWNDKITFALRDAAIETLLKNGVLKENILLKYVPGSYELTIASQYMCAKDGISGVIAIGCVIQGETKHFDFICNAVANGLTNVSLKYNKPVIFGVLTPNTMQQAMDRAGGKYGNKGDEAAYSLLKMLAF